MWALKFGVLVCFTYVYIVHSCCVRSHVFTPRRSCQGMSLCTVKSCSLPSPHSVWFQSASLYLLCWYFSLCLPNVITNSQAWWFYLSGLLMYPEHLVLSLEHELLGVEFMIRVLGMFPNCISVINICVPLDWRVWSWWLVCLNPQNKWCFLTAQVLLFLCGGLNLF